MKFATVIGSAVAATVIALATPALAQDAGAVVKERVAIMKANADIMKGLAASAKAGKVGAGDAAAAAKVRVGVTKFLTLFPAGSDSSKVKTRARPEIWKDWAKFQAEGNKLVAALGDVEKAAGAGDAKAMAGAVKVAQGTCGGCHKPFRGAAPK